MNNCTEDENTVAEKKLKLEYNEAVLPAAPGFTPPTPCSKNQLKKQKKRAQYVEIRKLKRLREKDRQKQKRREAAEKGLPVRSGPSRKELKKRQLAAEKSERSLRIAIDLDCDDMMIDRDVAKCVKQCLRIYTINRRLESPIKLHFTGIKSDGNIHNCLKKNDGWENWNLHYHFDETHLQAFDTTNVIYLTSESDTVLEKLNEKNVYVIGGLVDHNHYKNYCHERATKAGLKTARLPLGEYVDMKTRAVLTTFHVFEILVHVAEGNTWSDAILKTIPPRKGAKLKGSKDTKEGIVTENDICVRQKESKEHLSNDNENINPQPQAKSEITES